MTAFHMKNPGEFSGVLFVSLIYHDDAAELR